MDRVTSELLESCLIDNISLHLFPRIFFDRSDRRATWELNKAFANCSKLIQ